MLRPPSSTPLAGNNSTQQLQVEEGHIMEALSENDKYLTIALVQLGIHFLGRPMPKPVDFMGRIMDARSHKQMTFFTVVAHDNVGSIPPNLGDIICRFMARNDYGSVLLSPEHKELVGHDPILTDVQRRSLRALNRYLLVLIKAIILYRHTHAEFRYNDDLQTDLSGDFHERIHNAVMLVWDTVIGNLQILFRVLSYASQRGWVPLDEYPKDIDAYMERSAQEIITLRKNIDDTSQALLTQHTKILEENVELNTVRAKYEVNQRKYHELLGQLDLYKRMQQQYASVPFLLKQLYDAQHLSDIIKAGAPPPAATTTTIRPST
jgi:hypothetical protein